MVPPPSCESVSMTLLAVAGPLLVTIKVKVTDVPVGTLVAETDCVSARSAGFTVTVMDALLSPAFRSG